MVKGLQPFVVAVEVRGDTAVLQLSGELDVHGSHRLAEAVDRLISGPLQQIEIDAAGLTFVDSAGLQSLLLARQRAQTAGMGMRIDRSSRVLDRVVDMTQVHDELGLTSG